MRYNPLVIVVLLLIQIYRHAVSPFLQHRCRFFPSCSQYAYDAFLGFGFLTGMFLTTKRLLKCHPFHQGGFDPVPHAKKEEPRVT